MTINDLVLKVILLTINRVAGAQALHESNKYKFHYAVDCLAPTPFNLAEAIKVNMKRKLSKCKAMNLRQFKYGCLSDLLGMDPTVQLPDGGGESSSTMRSTDGPMERADAQIWRGPVDILQAFLLHMA